MSAEQLDAIDMRLRHVTLKYNEPFGGVDMILCGDLRHLPPIRASEIYKRTRGSNRGFTSEVKWHTMSYFPLVRVVRQKDARFSGMLTKIGDGVALDPQELSLIESRFVTAEEATRLAPDAVRLCYSNDSVNKYNVELAQNDAGATAIIAQDDLRGWRTEEDRLRMTLRISNMSSTELGNMPSKVVLSVGRPYMLTTNIDVLEGLVNGSVGVLKLCEWEPDVDFPKRVWIKFDAPGTGRVAIVKARVAADDARRRGHMIQADWIPIEPGVVSITLNTNREEVVKRKQYPLSQASAMTVRKSQGGTYGSVVYDYRKKNPQKFIYVGLSRCTDFERLYLTNGDGDFKFHHGVANADTSLANEFKRLKRYPLHTISKDCRAAFGRVGEGDFTFALLNVRSLHKHAADVNHDELLRLPTLLCFTETWNGRIQVDGYLCVADEFDADRKAGGPRPQPHPEEEVEVYNGEDELDENHPFPPARSDDEEDRPCDDDGSY
ncbi:ATP-dependent DNA helicase PIF1-like [Haemaphysalis longicornis]